MKKVFFVLAFIGCYTINAQEVLKPDLAPIKVVTNQYHGVTLEDPYQYMEDLSNPEVITWIKDNANYASSVLNNISEKKISLIK